jgi:hypothetical protein
LRVDSRSWQTRFRITARTFEDNGLTLVDQPDPFSAVQQTNVNVRDPRVDVLGRLCRSLQEVEEGHAARQQAIVALWEHIEEKSRRVQDL